MRKALIGLILAATVMTPVAAEAQNWRGRGGDRSEQGQDGGEARSERIQQRHQERQAQQQQQQQVQVQQAPQQQVQQAPAAQVVQRQRGGDGSRGNWRGNGDGGYRGNRGGGDASVNNVQGDNNVRGNWRGGNRGNGGNQGSIYPQAWQGNPNDPQLRHYQELERRNQQNGGNWRNDNRNDGGNWRNDNRNDGRNWRGDNRGGRTSWNRGWRNDNRYDWQGYRHSNRNLYHVGPYYSPYRGYGYNRFSIGIFLDPFFYGQQYWIGDPWQYRLPPAYPGTQWVRYYNDVLLVDVYTGEVLDTIYDFFW